jgi:hypothetical protein
MASITGSITKITDSSFDGTQQSQAITVPSDAEKCVVVSLALTLGTFEEPNLTTLSFDGTGLDFTEIIGISSRVTSYRDGATMWYLDSPPTGSQTLYWTFVDSFSEQGAVLYVLFLKDVASGVAASDSTRSSTGINVSLDVSTGASSDISIIAGMVEGGGYIDLDNDSQTVFDDSTFNNLTVSLAYEAGEDTMYVRSGDSTAAVAARFEHYREVDLSPNSIETDEAIVEQLELGVIHDLTMNEIIHSVPVLEQMSVGLYSVAAGSVRKKNQQVVSNLLEQGFFD